MAILRPQIRVETGRRLDSDDKWNAGSCYGGRNISAVTRGSQPKGRFNRAMVFFDTVLAYANCKR